MIELAPHHKHGLSIKNPILTASGSVGYSNEYRRLIPLEALGALVTNPITAKPRRGARPPRTIQLTGGVLMHIGLENPGLASVIHRHRQHWQHSPIPVIAHVAGVNPDEAATCAQQLSGTETVAAIELGLPDSLPLDEAVEVVRVARAACLLPLIVKLPLWQARRLAARIADLDCADALTVAASPRGSVWHGGRPFTGRLHGWATFPQALWELCQVVQIVGDAIPLIGCGGIHCADDVLAMLRVGAKAVQVDSYIWRDPAGLARLAETARTWTQAIDRTENCV